MPRPGPHVYLCSGYCGWRVYQSHVGILGSGGSYFPTERRLGGYIKQGGCLVHTVFFFFLILFIERYFLNKEVR